MPNDARINVLTLGEGGVDVDTDPILTADNATLQSQNATYDPTLARAGALTKRPGLDRFNTVALGGIVLGGVEVPYAGLAGAPPGGGGGGGNPGDGGGTGNPQDGGGTVPGDPIDTGTGTNAGGSVLSSGQTTSVLFGGKRLVAVGRWDNSDLATLNASWYLTDTAFADAAYLLTPTNTTAGPPAAEGPNASFPLTVGAMSVEHRYTTANGALYYQQHIPAQTAASAPVLPVVRRMSADGKQDQAILTIPDNPAVLKIVSSSGPPPVVCTHLVGITAMQTEWGNGDAMWVAVYDKVTNTASAGDYGRVLRITGLDSGNYVITEVFNSVNTTTTAALLGPPSVPYCLENFLGNMWMGIFRGNNTTHPTFTMLRADGTVAKGTTDSSTAYADVMCMKVYNGILYIGYANRDPSVAHAVIAYYTADDGYGVSLTGTGGTPVSVLGFVSMEVFGGKLYATYFNPTQASKIYSFDGTTWTAVYTASTSNQKNAPLVLRADGSYLYAWGGFNSGNFSTFLSSPDGTNWTDQSANFTGTHSQPTNLLFGMDQ